LPLVFTHGDLNGLNILTNNDGHVSSVIDWGESTWKPFGMGLYGLDTFLGSMRPEGYSSVEGHEQLRDRFFETMWIHMPPEMFTRKRELEKAVRVAETVGILHRHLEWRNEESKVLSQHSLQYLEGALKLAI
jgi:hypothetical protein